MKITQDTLPLPKRMESQIRKALYDYKMLEEANVAVALSGGKDSLTLLKGLKQISGKGFLNLNLTAIHVGGEFSCGAGVHEGFLQAFCDKLEIPLLFRYSKQKLETLECYSCSRERRKLIFDAAKEAGAKTIAFGHHRDDSAQTLLINLLHKGEFAGNLPKVTMHEYGVNIIRPLILVSEDAIKEYARSAGFLRALCQCPVGQNSMRKKADKLIDELEAIFPNARANIASAGLTYGSRKANER
ncbi:MAG: tRNA 2-thiocytidine biosynthesis protein TtcA [Chlamydiia bacterium]|nr:tRNA 2-thiocytidine biosynthesis protein TtcA [Chlamydiia bacterium]